MTYLDLVHDCKLQSPQSKLELVQYYLKNGRAQSLTAAAEVCLLSHDSVICEYCFYPAEASKKFPGKIVSVCICALARGPLDFAALGNSFQKHDPARPLRKASVPQAKVPKLVTEPAAGKKSAARNQVTSKTAFERQAKLDFSGAAAEGKKTPNSTGEKAKAGKDINVKKGEVVQDKRSGAEKAKEMAEEKAEETKSNGSAGKSKSKAKGKKPAKEPMGKKQKRAHELVMEPPTQPPKSAKKSKTEESESPETKNKVVDLAPAPVPVHVDEYKEVTKTRKDKKTRYVKDESGYLVAEDYYEEVQYTERVKVKNTEEEEPLPTTSGKKGRKKSQDQPSIMSFFNKK